MKNFRNLPGKARYMIVHVLLLSAFFSCSKKDAQELQAPPIDPASKSNSTILAKATGNILYRETFENNSIFPGLNTQFETPYAFNAATNLVFQGSRSGRFELRNSDPENNGGTRSEVVFPVASNLNRWYSFAVYFPSSDFKYDDGDESLGQWKQHESGVSSAISLRIKEDKFRLTIIPSYKTTSEKIDLGPVTKDRWLTFVMHVRHSTGDDGLIELWINGKKIVNRSGSNMYKLSSQSGMTNPEWKLGIYKSGWNGSQTTSTAKRVLYYDDIRLGNENATLADMTPVANGGSIPELPGIPNLPEIPELPGTGSPSNPSLISSVTLVSAHTEQDIVTVSNGTSISLAPIPVDKLNIRANTSGSFKSMKFELSGAQLKTYLDSNAPFTLNGDDGGSNYYFGSWNPPVLGSYTLKVTPYSGAKGTGTAGIPYTVSFSFIK